MSEPVEVRAPLQGTVIRIAAVGTNVTATATVVVIESMKMEHTVEAGADGVVGHVGVAAGDNVNAGDLLVVLDTVADSTAADRVAHADAPAQDATGTGERRPPC